VGKQDHLPTLPDESTIMKPRIALVIPRGEAVRNFLYSDTLTILNREADVLLLSVVNDEQFAARFRPHVTRLEALEEYREQRIVYYWRILAHNAHFRWIWTEVAKNRSQTYDNETTTLGGKVRRALWKALVRLLAYRPIVEAMTDIEQVLSTALRPTRHFDTMFADFKPDLVFNGSHIHGQAADLPLKVAHKMGIRTAGFIFSWDNLTSRSRIFTPYDDFLVWHNNMRDDLLCIYPRTDPARVHVTGTPQMDYHFKPQYHLSREELCARIGLDPTRPFILYTTSIPRHFPDEHFTVERTAHILDSLPLNPKPQLLIRTYAKGTSDEMKALAAKGLPNTVFQPLFWNEKWLMPLEEDLTIYSSLMRHTAMGINGASTVSLELMMHDKPVINLDFDPPGSNLPPHLHWHRHIIFDHYAPVAKSGGVMLAQSIDDMGPMMLRGLTQPHADSEARTRFIQSVFGSTLDGCSGERVANKLLELARKAK
jgi:hypothetical protein